MPHQWLNVETDAEAKQLNTTGAEVSSLPIVVFPDGSFLSNPATSGVAHKLGLKTKAEFPFYDLVVVGAGPAGLAAAVYGAADGLKTLSRPGETRFKVRLPIHHERLSNRQQQT